MIQNCGLFATSFLRETQFLVWWYRLLGASIGPNVVLNTNQLWEADLVTIGANCVIDHDVRVETRYFMRGSLILGPITIQSGCYVGHRAALLPFSYLEQDCFVDAMSTVSFGQEVPHNSSWRGSPILPLEPRVDTQALTWYRCQVSSGCRLGFLHLMGLYLVACIFFAGAVTTTYVNAWLAIAVQGSWPTVLENGLYAAVAFFSFKIAVCAQAIFLKWLLLGCVRPGRKRITTWLLFRHWIMDRLLTSDLSRGMIGDVFSNLFLQNFVTRIMGANISVRQSMLHNAFFHSDLDLLEVGESVWFGDSVAIFCSRFEGMDMVFEPVKIESGVMVGDGATLDAGTILRARSTLGTFTHAYPGFQADEFTVWIGSPPALIQTASEQSQQNAVKGLVGEDAGQQHSAVAYYLSSFAFQCLDLIFVVALVMSFLGIFTLLQAVYQPTGAIWSLVFEFLLFYTTSAVIMVLFCLLIGACVPPLQGAHPRFGLYSLLWQFMGVVLGYAYAYVFQFFEGTPLITGFMRAMGGNIGSNVYYVGPLVREIKTMTLEDDVVVNQAGLNGHSADNGRLQFGEIVLKTGVSLNSSVVVHPGTQIGSHCTIGQNSVVMKGERLPDGSHWQGTPLAPSFVNINTTLKQLTDPTPEGVVVDDVSNDDDNDMINFMGGGKESFFSLSGSRRTSFIPMRRVTTTTELSKPLLSDDYESEFAMPLLSGDYGPSPNIRSRPFTRDSTLVGSMKMSRVKTRVATKHGLGTGSGQFDGSGDFRSSSMYRHLETRDAVLYAGGPKPSRARRRLYAALFGFGLFVAVVGIIVLVIYFLGLTSEDILTFFRNL